MNGVAAELFQSDCPLATCHWVSDPLPGAEAAHEARRKHLSEHPHGDLVAHACATHTVVTRYVQAPA